MKKIGNSPSSWSSASTPPRLRRLVALLPDPQPPNFEAFAKMPPEKCLSSWIFSADALKLNLRDGKSLVPINKSCNFLLLFLSGNFFVNF